MVAAAVVANVHVRMDKLNLGMTCPIMVIWACPVLMAGLPGVTCMGANILG